MDGWLPEACAKENKGGTPVILLLFFFVVGIIPIVTGMNTSDIANMGTGCGKLTDLLMVYACFRLPKVFPEEYRKSALYMSPAKLNVALAVVFRCTGSYFLCQPVQLKCKTVPVHWSVYPCSDRADVSSL